jgi:hypothetical protein
MTDEEITAELNASTEIAERKIAEIREKKNKTA